MTITYDSKMSPQEIWDQDIAATAQTSAQWVLPGFVARGNLTLLTSMWKSGKTTLLSHLLVRRANGRPLLGRDVAPGKSVVISEEPRPLWAERCQKLAFGGQLCLFPQPFPHLPTADEWRRLIDRIGKLQSERGVDLLVIDSVTHFLRAETASIGIHDLLMPLRELTGRGMAVLLMHHPRRRSSGAGSAGRGHGALHSEVDISIEMRHAGDNLDSRVRRFFCLSRHADTPRHLRFELNADGSDYTVLPEPDDDGFTNNWEVLRMVLEDAPQKLTRNDILDEWPDDFPKPCGGTLWKWLQDAIAADLVQVEGTGKKSDPLRYWLSATEARWREAPLYDCMEKQARDLKLPFVSLRKRRSESNDNVGRAS
jgi:AAA domain